MPAASLASWRPRRSRPPSSGGPRTLDDLLPVDRGRVVGEGRDVADPCQPPPAVLAAVEAEDRQQVSPRERADHPVAEAGRFESLPEGRGVEGEVVILGEFPVQLHADIASVVSPTRYYNPRIDPGSTRRPPWYNPGRLAGPSPGQGRARAAGDPGRQTPAARDCRRAQRPGPAPCRGRRGSRASRTSPGVSSSSRARRRLCTAVAWKWSRSGRSSADSGTAPGPEVRRCQYSRGNIPCGPASRDQVVPVEVLRGAGPRSARPLPRPGGRGNRPARASSRVAPGPASRGQDLGRGPTVETPVVHGGGREPRTDRRLARPAPGRHLRRPGLGVGPAAGQQLGMAARLDDRGPRP